MRCVCIIVVCGLLSLIGVPVRADHESSKQPQLWTPHDEAERLGAMEVPGGMVLVPAGSFLMGSDPRKTVPPARRNSHSMRFISTRSGSTGSRCQTLSILDSSSGREQIGRSSGERIPFLKRQHSIP